MNWVKTFVQTADCLFFCLFCVLKCSWEICKYANTYIIRYVNQPNVIFIKVLYFISTKKPTDGHFFSVLLAANGSFWNVCQYQFNVSYTSCCFFQIYYQIYCQIKRRISFNYKCYFLSRKLMLVKLNICQFLAFIFHNFLFVVCLENEIYFKRRYISSIQTVFNIEMLFC